MPINTVIVDDERPARDELLYLLKAFPEINVVAMGKNGLEAIALIKEHNPDLLFLDVQMPGLDGFGVIKKLVERKLHVPQIVFATAFDNYAIQAFEVNAVDYVLKPFDKARVAKAVQRAKKLIEAHTSTVDRLENLVGQLGAGAAKPRVPPVKLLVKSQSRMILVDAEDMIYASIEDGTITIFAADVEGASSFRTIEELAEALDKDLFWRAHRSYLVNINHIKEVVPWFKSSYMLKMNDKRQSEIPVARAQTKRLRERLPAVAATPRSKLRREILRFAQDDGSVGLGRKDPILPVESGHSLRLRSEQALREWLRASTMTARWLV